MYTNRCSPLTFNQSSGLMTAMCAATQVQKSITGGLYQVPSIINARMCSSYKVNVTAQGMLLCSSGAARAGLPSGSWGTSCAPLAWDKDTAGLVAQCGTTPWSEAVLLNYTLCNAGATVSNNKGVLVCSALAAGVPSGSWFSSCAPVFYGGNPSMLLAVCLPKQKFT